MLYRSSARHHGSLIIRFEYFVSTQGKSVHIVKYDFVRELFHSLYIWDGTPNSFFSDVIGQDPISTLRFSF